MATVLDPVFRDLARDLLVSYGTSIVIKKPSATTASPSTQSWAQTFGTSQTVKCSPPSPYDVRLIDGTNVQRGDLQTLVAATDANLTFAPETGHHAEIDSKTWRVVKANPIWSGDQVAAYDLQLRAH